MHRTAKICILVTIGVTGMRCTCATKLTRHYPQGSCLFRQGERCKGTFIVLRGTVAVLTDAQVSGELPVACAKRFDVIGLPETIGSHAWQTTGLAVTDVTIHFIPTKDVLSMMTDDTEIRFRILELMTAELSHLYQKIRISHVDDPR